ncbi:PIN domain-containing protein [Escherichia coli]|nr:PIN domain-containing protein [Escherichia coli]
MANDILHLVLDSNVLHEEGLNSNDMKLLKKYTDKGLIRIHLPSLVAKEFVTRKSNNLIDGLEKSKQSLDSVERDARGISEELLECFDELKKKIINAKNDIGNKPQECFDRWVQDFKVSIVDTIPDSVNEVFNDYFLGKGVFRKPKAREDIPDAFICVTIINLLSEFGSIVVVNKDKAFRKHLSEYDKIQVLQSLREVFSLKGIDLLEDESMLDLIHSAEFVSALSQYLRQRPDAFEYVYLHEDEISKIALIGQRIYGASIEVENYNDIANASISDARSIDEHTYSALLSFDMNVNINYITDYGTFLDIERTHGRRPEMESMNGDGICDVSENALTKFYGDLTVKFKKNREEIDKSDIVRFLLDEDIFVQFEIKNIEIIEML